MELYGVGVRRRRRRRGELVAKKLKLNTYTVNSNASPGTKLADITNKISTSSLTLLDSDSGRFSLMGSSIMAGGTPIGTAVPVRYITIVERQPNGVEQRTVIAINTTEGGPVTARLDFSVPSNSGYLALLHPALTPVGTTPTTLTNTINYLGETFTLSQPMKVGYTLNGQPFIVTDTAGSWSASTNPSATVDGYVAHGAMFDPRIIDGAEYPAPPGSSNTQGFDQMLANGTLGTGALGASGSIPWSSTQNIDPAASGAYSLAGKVGRLVKSVRVTGGGLGEFCLLQKFININLVPSVPPAGAISPIFDGNGGVEWLTTNNVTKSIFAGDGYVSGEETLASCITNNYLPGDTDWPLWIDNGEKRRGLMPRRSWWATTGYSRDFGGVWNRLVNACHAEGAGAVSDSIFYRMLTLGALCLENVRRGNVQRGGAGQNIGLKPMAVLAGMASRNTAHYALAKQFEGNETHQAFWPTSAFTNIATGFPNGAGTGSYNRQPFLPEHYGRAAFFHGGQDITAVSPAVDTILYDSDLAPRYQHTSWTSAGLGLSNCLRFVNGPGGKTGVNLVLNDGTVSSTNPYSACIPAMWRYTTFNNDVDSYLSAFATSEERVRTRQTVAAAAGSAAMTPDPVSPMKNQAAYLTATTTGYTWNYSSWDVGGPIKPITRVDHRSTLDGGRTFFVESNVGETGTKSTAVPYGIDIGVQNRRWSSDGAGPWSVNYPKVEPGAAAYPNSQLPRFVIRPSGTPIGTPVNIQAPAIVYRPLTNWNGPYFEPVPQPVSLNLTVFAGVGWWTGNLTPGFTYQWFAGNLANGSDRVAISGATSSSFVVTSAQANKYLSVGITCSGVTAFSTPVQISAPVYPAMTLTAFDGVNDYLTRSAALAGAVNGRKFTFSFTGSFDVAGNGVVQRLCTFGDGTTGTSSSSQLLSVERRPTNNLQIIARSVDGTGTGNGTVLFNGTTSGTAGNLVTSANGEVTITVSVDLDAARYQVCVNNTVIPWAAAPTVLVQDIPFTSMLRPWLLVALSGAADFRGNHRCTFFHTDSLDLSVAANRDKFLPANIGNRGEGVFGVDALVMIFGPASSIGTNYGTGGNYTLVGSVTDV